MQHSPNRRLVVYSNKKTFDCATKEKKGNKTVAYQNKKKAKIPET